MIKINIKKIYQERFTNKEEHQMVWKTLTKNFFQNYINKNDVVLDLGCGYGEFINNVNGGKKIAVDLNPEAKNFIKKEVKFFASSSTKMTFIKSSSVDKIFVSNFFEHLSRDDIILTIKELKRVLKKRGQVLVLQPNIRFLPHDFWRFFDHLTPIDDRALEEIFNTYDFKLKKRILKFLPYTTKSRFPQSPFLVKLYLKLPFLWWIFGKQSFLVFEKL